MVKKADRYFLIDPWKIIEEGFDKEYSRVAESVFSLGNEYMGVRGYFEEGYSGDTLLGSYFNGIYEQERTQGSAYKGIVDKTEFMVNAVDWLYTRIQIQEEALDLATSVVSDFKRVLDLRTGVLTRSFVWHLKSGGRVQIQMERFLPMAHAQLGAQRVCVTSMDYQGKVEISMGLDFAIMHQSRKKNYWDVLQKRESENSIEMLGRTIHTKQLVYAVSRFTTDAQEVAGKNRNEKILTKTYAKELEPNERFEITRLAQNIVYKEKVIAVPENLIGEWRKKSRDLEKCSYEELRAENEQWWADTWAHSDIQIDGDEGNQQGIRFCIFQMFQTYQGAELGDNIGAKGLTGEAYNGNAFWDTETCCLPFYMFNNLEAAKNLLLYRYVTLPEAKAKAEALDCEGAFYPIATISGRECCDLWQHASLQLQASTGVVYGIWLYEKITDDQEFLIDQGIEMLVEVCRMLATRGSWSADGTEYGYYCVMGPDEFQMMVNHNCYTNYMGRFSFDYTREVLQRVSRYDQEKYMRLVEKLNISLTELDTWHRMSQCMYIPKDEKKHLYEQHEGFFKLPHVDVDAIPITDFPLYSHWSYDRIYRNDMIKQADVLMLMLMFNHRFTEAELKANYEYYEPRCIHESSLSPAVHAILASQLKKHEEAYDFFQFATRMDLDNYNRNSTEGLHTTSIAAAWMNIVCGFGGLRFDGAMLEFTPSIPAEWKGYAFRIVYKGIVLLVQLQKEIIIFQTLEDANISIKVYGENYHVSQQPIQITIPEEWRG